MNFLRFAAIVSICAVLAACSADPISKRRTDNPDIDLSLLFTVDGCKVYRFSDGGNSRYFTTCVGSMSWTEHQGKTERPVEVPTGRPN